MIGAEQLGNSQKDSICILHSSNKPSIPNARTPVSGDLAPLSDLHMCPGERQKHTPLLKTLYRPEGMA